MDTGVATLIETQAPIFQVLTIPFLTFQIRQSSLKMTVKSSLKDKLEDDELDLSMMQLSEVPVRVRRLRLKHIVKKYFYLASSMLHSFSLRT